MGCYLSSCGEKIWPFPFSNRANSQNEKWDLVLRLCAASFNRSQCLYLMFFLSFADFFHFTFKANQDFCSHRVQLNTVLFCRTLDVTLDLKDPHYPEHNLGTLELSVTLSPKEGDVRDAVRNPHKITHSFLSHTLLSFIRGQHSCLHRIHIPTDTSNSRKEMNVSDVIYPNTEKYRRPKRNQTLLHLMSINSLSNCIHQSSAAVLFPAKWSFIHQKHHHAALCWIALALVRLAYWKLFNSANTYA